MGRWEWRRCRGTEKWSKLRGGLIVHDDFNDAKSVLMFRDNWVKWDRKATWETQLNNNASSPINGDWDLKKTR